MANEFWNIVAGIIGGIIIGFALHSGMGHTWGKLLWKIFHKGERPYCYGRLYSYTSIECDKCLDNVRCREVCRTSIE